MKSQKFDPEKLGKDLAEYGSLPKAIEAMRGQMSSLQAEIESLQKNKTILVPEVEALVKKRNALKKEIDDLESIKQKLSHTIQQLQEKVKDLVSNRDRLEKEVHSLQIQETNLRQHNEELISKQKDMEEKLIALPEINRQIVEKTATLNDLESKIKEAGTQFKLFKSFLGFVKANSLDQIEEFFNEIPSFIDTARGTNYSVEAIKRVMFDKFTGGVFDVMKCASCNAEFVLTKKPQGDMSLIYTSTKTKPEQCPICSSRLIQLKEELIGKLEQEFKKNPNNQ